MFEIIKKTNEISFQLYIQVKLLFGLFICHEILFCSSSLSLSQFGPHFLKNDSIWSSLWTL